jgi:hypothetical protein
MLSGLGVLIVFIHTIIGLGVFLLFKWVNETHLISVLIILLPKVANRLREAEADWLTEGC